MSKQIQPQTSTPSSCCEPHLTQCTSHQTRKSATRSRLHHTRDVNNSPSRQQYSSFHRLPTHILLLTFSLLLTCIAPTVSASALYIPEQMVETPKHLAPAAPEKPEDPRSALLRLATSGPILVDLSDEPSKDGNPEDWTLASIEDDLRRRKKRQVGGDEEATTTTKSTTSAKSTTSRQATTTLASITSATSSTTSTRGGIAVAEETGTRPLPQVFDSGFNANLTSSCQTFMRNMLANETFKSCLPVSLLIQVRLFPTLHITNPQTNIQLSQNSNSYFQTARSVLLLTRLLDFTCAANSTVCVPLMANLATNLTLSTTCKDDYDAGNPQIHQAQLGLLSYRPLFTATCLRNPVTSSYCFADAVTNSTSPDDGFVYFLPLNGSFPTDGKPTCTTCLKDTMAVFSGAEAGGKDAKGANAALAYTYAPASQRINSQCGAGFVNTSLAVPVVNGATSSWRGGGGGGVGGAGTFALLLMVASLLL